MKYQSSAHAAPGRKVRLALEQRTARLTVLIDPRKKVAFERLCAEEDTTPSQVVRRLIRAYLEERTGRPWRADEPKVTGGPKTARSAKTARHPAGTKLRTDGRVRERR
jgi:hypothetical protein